MNPTYPILHVALLSETKSSITTYLTTFFAIIVMLQSVSGEIKMIGSGVSNRQPLTVCHVRIITKSCEKVCSPRTTQ